MATNLFGSDCGATLLCGDHIMRGPRPKQMLHSVTFVLIEVAIAAMLTWECLCGGGNEVLGVIVGVWFGDDTKGAAEYMQNSPKELNIVKAYALLAASCAYLVRVSYWTLFVQHTGSTGFRTLFMIFWYHVFLHGSQAVVAYIPEADRELSQLTLVGGLLLAFVGFALELAADMQMAKFKAEKAQYGLLSSSNGSSRVLDTGLWAMCRHPNYLFNAIGVAGLAFLTGFWPCGVFWFCFQCLWVFIQSGPAHEAYMAKNYGSEWEDYTKRVGFLFPRLC